MNINILLLLPQRKETPSVNIVLGMLTTCCNSPLQTETVGIKTQRSSGKLGAQYQQKRGRYQRVFCIRTCNSSIVNEISLVLIIQIVSVSIIVTGLIGITLCFILVILVKILSKLIVNSWLHLQVKCLPFWTSPSKHAKEIHKIYNISEPNSHIKYLLEVMFTIFKSFLRGTI